MIRVASGARVAIRCAACAAGGQGFGWPMFRLEAVKKPVERTELSRVGLRSVGLVWFACY